MQAWYPSSVQQLITVSSPSKGPSITYGCPDPDIDQDSLPDRIDECPTRAGLTKNQGCPAGQNVRIRNGKLVYQGQIYFKSKSSKIKRKSYKLLDEVIDVLKENPSLRISIEGHTTQALSQKKSLLLSKNRANEVLTYFVKRGIDAA